MEKTNEGAETPGSKVSNLKRAFKVAILSSFTCSREEFAKRFPNFTPAEVQRLYSLFSQMSSSLQEFIEDEFEFLCEETQAGTKLNMVEQLVEEQCLDPFSSERSNIEEAARDFIAELEKVKEKSRSLASRVEVLKESRQDFSGRADIHTETRMVYQKYGTGKRRYPDN